MHEESGRWDEVSELWKRASDREKIKFLVVIGTPALGIGLIGIIVADLGVAVFLGLPGILMFFLAIAIWRKRQIQKVITPRWYGLVGKGIIWRYCGRGYRNPGRRCRGRQHRKHGLDGHRRGSRHFNRVRRRHRHSSSGVPILEAPELCPCLWFPRARDGLTAH